jgi:hypothetical protein
VFPESYSRSEGIDDGNDSSLENVELFESRLPRGYSDAAVIAIRNAMI